jgi:hypothetical protein
VLYFQAVFDVSRLEHEEDERLRAWALMDAEDARPSTGDHERKVHQSWTNTHELREGPLTEAKTDRCQRTRDHGGTDCRAIRIPQLHIKPAEQGVGALHQSLDQTHIRG